MADLDTGAVLAPGEVGEIQVRSPSVMAGYLPDEATASAFADGWYRTGDVGWLEPEGWVHLTDRAQGDDQGQRVPGGAGRDRGACCTAIPAVLDCAVFGVADERAGEVPVAAVQLDPDTAGRPPRSCSELVADSLATYKRLRHVVVVDSHPARCRRARCCGATLRDEWAAGASPARGAG